MKPIETKRLLIRHMHADDAAFILGLLNEPAFLKNIGDKQVRTIEDALNYIQTAGFDNYAKHGFGMFMVELLDSGVHVGICGLLQREVFDFPDVGFALSEAFWGKGYATEAASAVKDWAQLELGVEMVLGIVAQDNLASRRLLEKLGLSFEKLIRMSEDAPEICFYS